MSAPGCIEGREIDVEPNFFVADSWEGTVTIRVQHGGDFEYLSDGMKIFLADAEEVAGQLGRAIPVSPDAGAPLRMNLYLHERCRVSTQDDEPPINYVAVEGAVTFESVYAPDLDENRLRTEASFDEVLFVDTRRPDERFARMSGRIDFLFNRGRPAQRFP